MKLNRRKMTDEEKILLKILMTRGNFIPLFDWENELLVSPMNDGGMGSLYLYPPDVTEDKRRNFGYQISEYVFKDIDGIDVISSLNLDENGLLYELDIWRIDYNPVIQLPSAFNN